MQHHALKAAVNDLRAGTVLASASVRALEGVLMTVPGLLLGVGGKEVPHAEQEAPHGAENDLPGADEQPLEMSAPSPAARHQVGPVVNFRRMGKGGGRWGEKGGAGDAGHRYSHLTPDSCMICC